MLDAKPGEIWRADVPFEENDGRSKVRPALVLQLDTRNRIYHVFKITKTKPRSSFPGEYRIRNWKESGLRIESTLRLSQPIMLEPHLLKYKIGTLHPDDLSNVYRILSKLYPRLQQSRVVSQDDSVQQSRERDG